MSSDLVFHEDIYNDLFITHGGLLSKRTCEVILNSASGSPESSLVWQVIKKYVLKAINTHDEVKERQPFLAGLYKELKLGRDIKPLQKEGDLLLRDFIVEVKQPSSLKIGSVESSSIEANDQQLLRAMRFRKRKWGILTNGAEWQFVYEGDEELSEVCIPFVSFSVIDMIADEKNAAKQINFFINLLTNREFRHYLISDSNDNKWRATKSFSNSIGEIINDARGLDCNEEDINSLVKLIFKMTFLFYAEDMGALPRLNREYKRYDIRKHLKRHRKLTSEIIEKSIKAFADQKWSAKKEKESGNSSFWDSDFKEWVLDNIELINQLDLTKLWFNETHDELDMSEISSSDLCDVYQNCVHFDSENVGTVYTSKGLSNFINHMILKNARLPIREGDIILDPACGSGHLLKRVLFIANQLVTCSETALSHADLVEYLCSKVLCGIDKNETAVFITKINLWLSCVRKGKSLPVLRNVICDNTLQRFTDAFSSDEKQRSKFLGGLGKRVIALISNPPWSMVFGNHPEKWLAESKFWKDRKNKITRQDNTALSFGFLSHEILDKDGIGILIMPGVFFVGSTAKLRDYLVPKVVAYAPSARNSDFTSVDPSQNFGIVCFKSEKRKSENIMLYTGLDSGRLNVDYIDNAIFEIPKLRKSTLPALDKKFVTDTLLPLFSDQNSLINFKFYIENSIATLSWDKGSKGKPIKGPEINSKKLSLKSSSKYYVGSENRGNSPNPVLIFPFSKKDFDLCSHKILRLDLSGYSNEDKFLYAEMFNSQSFNDLVNTLKTSKSTQSAVLNILGFPSIPSPSVAELKALLDKAKSVKKLANKKTKKVKKNTA